MPGQDQLQFGPIPSKGQVTSSNTFTVLIDKSFAFDFSKLQWTFQPTASGQAPVANAGPNQTVAVGSVVTLNGSGSTNPSGIGALTYSWRFTSRPSGTSSVLIGGSTAMPAFIADVSGTFVIALTVSNGVASSTAEVSVSTASSPAPVANAGPNQSVAVGSTVVLNGSASTSASGKPLTYTWKLTAVPSGSVAWLAGANSLSSTFLADRPGVYTAQLIVSDGILSSAPSTVSISTSVVKPIANAGGAQVVNVGATVHLNGSGSTDANALPLTFQWTFNSKPAGSAAVLSNPSAVNPTFIADAPGIYVAQLVVNNGLLNSDPSTTAVTTSSAAPTADAGQNQTVALNGMVQLRGSGTDPQNLPLSYQWSIINRPPNSSATLSSAVVTTPTFVADQPGSYVVQLVVNNGYMTSAPATVTISTGCGMPTANAGPTQAAVATDSTVTLDGSASTGACQGSLTYSWSLTVKPAGSSATLTSPASASPKFVADVAGTYVAQLMVNNGFASSSPSTVTITAAARSALSLSPASLDIAVNSTGTLMIVLPAPAANSISIVLASNAPSIASVPPSVVVPAGATSATATVAGVSAGTTAITASATGYAAAVANINVTAGQGSSGIVIAPNVAVPVGQSAALPVTLSSPAPWGGMFITLTSNDPSRATVAPANMFIPQGASAPSRIPTVTGLSAGPTVITASGYGLVSVSQTVQVTSGAAVTSMSLSPSTLAINGTATQNLTLTLSAPTPSALTVTLASGNNNIASVLAAVSVGAGASTVSVPVTGIAAGSATITASAPGYGSATATVNVSSAGSSSGIILDSGVTVGVGQSAPLFVRLAAPAPSGGIFITLSSSDTQKATVAPENIFIPQDATAPFRTPTITGISSGSVLITASGFGLIPVSQTVQVGSTAPITPIPTPATMTFSPATLSMTGSEAKNLTLVLSVPVPASSSGLAVALSSDNPRVATVPTTTAIAANSAMVVIPVTAVGPGMATITASAPGIASTTAAVTVAASSSSGTIILPSSTAVGVGQFVTLGVALSSPAPTGGVSVALASSDSSKVTVTPGVFIAAGATAPVQQPQLTGIDAGSAVITASATGYQSASVPVTATSAAAGSSHIWANLSINAGITQNLSLDLSGPAPAGLTATITFGTPGIATAPATVAFVSGASSVNIPVTGVGQGNTTITATTPGFGVTTATVTVFNSAGVTVKWHGACWYNGAFYGRTGNFQAIDFELSAPSPVPLQGSLFFTSNCDPKNGVDNMNDYGSLTGSTHTVQGFTHFPDQIPSSALFWIGDRTPDGKCPAGSVCSGCVTYTTTTPDCSSMP